MMSIVQFLAPRQKILAAIERNEDVIYVCPKYCLGDQLLNSIMTELKTKQAARCAYLTPKLKPTTSEIDYASAWHSVTQQLELKSKDNPRTEDEFSRSLAKAVTRVSGKIIVFLKVLGTGKEEETFKLLYTLNRLGFKYRTIGKSLNFVCLDDFSFWFFERYLSGTQGVQSQIIAQHVVYWAVLPEETRGLLASTFREKLNAQETDELTRAIQCVSGGHIGLIGEMCEQVQRNDQKLEWDKLSDWLRRAAVQSEVLEGLRRDIEEDPIGLAQTALECVEPEVVAENSSPRYQFLRQLGILQVHSPAELVLCPGLIREFVEGMSKARARSRLGTVVTNYGMREFVDEEPKIADDDFVVVHLSDLHVGKDYGYRLSFGGAVRHEGKEALPDLIERDLKRMKVVGRIDAVVLSGDLVCVGDYDEFNRVLEIVERLMQALKVDKDRFLIIPGNHDLKWNPGDFAPRVSAGREVSMEAFQKFLDGLRKEKFSLCNIMPLASRSGRNRLRLVGIDSNDVEGPEAGGIGYISKETLAAAGKLLDADDIAGYANVATWLVVHHHVLPVTSATRSDARIRKISVMSNAQDLIAAATNWHVEAILHGHEHQPSITWAQRWAGQNFNGTPQGICVIGAGSCGVSRDQLGPVSRNQYYLLVKSQDDILIRSRVIGDDGLEFMPHNDILISNGAAKR
jgi:3',5'-cyclic AMP phosphodiesterase CpdA